MAPWLNRCSYWMPNHYVESAWLSHAPFAFWLIDAVRPKLVGELGTHNGFSFFVFAEAVKRLGLDTQLYALDSWEGDDHAGFYSEDVYASVKQISETDYAASTHLVRGYFNQSVDTFEDGAIDLLHIDGRHGYEDVLEDFNLYLPKLSDRAVVIFHDTFEFKEGFGVHRFWDELAKTRPSFNFEHGHGLGVLAYGKTAPSAVLSFIDVANARPEEVRESYYNLGESVMVQFSLIETLETFRQDSLRAHELDRRLEESAQALIAIRQSSSWRLTAPVRAVSSRLRPHG
jgi:hypothetical protein